MNILWFGKTGEANAWYHITLTTSASVVNKVYVVRHKKPIREIRTDKVSFYEAGGCSGFFMSLVPLVRKAHGVLRKEKVDAMITFNVFPYGFVAYLLARIYRKKLILCFIGSDFNIYFKQQPYRKLIIGALRRSDLVICKGELMVEEISSVGIDKEKLAYYPHFASDEYFLNNRYGPFCFDVVNISDFRPGKRLEVLVKALKLLKDEGLHCKACFIGEGPEKQNIVRLSEKLGVRSQVAFTGFAEDVLYYLKRARFYVQTSEREALSLSLLEAIAAGLIPVCTEAGAERDVIENKVNGVFTKIGDERDLAKALKYVSDPQVYEQMRERCMAMRHQLRMEKAGERMDMMLRPLTADSNDDMNANKL